MGQPGRSPMKLDCLTCIVPKGQPDPPRQSKHCIGTQVTKSARGKSWFVAHESRATIDCDSNKCPLPRRSPTRYRIFHRGLRVAVVVRGALTHTTIGRCR